MDEIAIVEVPPTSPRRMAGRGFAINGRPLGVLVALGDKVCVLDTPDRARTRRAARELRGAASSELASGRVPIYVCAECGDLGCGAVTVRVTELDDCFALLRKELQGKGHVFVTRSDTEVLLHAYDEWGEGCVTHLNASSPSRSG